MCQIKMLFEKTFIETLCKCDGRVNFMITLHSVIKLSKKSSSGKSCCNKTVEA